MRISDWSSDVCSSDLAQFPQPHRGRQTPLVRCRPAHRRRQTKNKAAFYLLPGDIRIDLRAAIDRSDNAPDAQPVLLNAGLHQNGDMAARHAVTGEALPAARAPPPPPAPRGARRTA